MNTKNSIYQKSPRITYYKIQLPLTQLHYLKCGVGPSLVMVPATISKINNWLSLVQFMAQRFTVYFFELPGHGQSTPFKQPYSSYLVARTIENFLDKLKIPKTALMGFSFGGILALKTLEHLDDRVTKVIFFAPCVSKKAVRFSQVRLNIIKSVNSIMHTKPVQKEMLKLIRNEKTVDFIMLLLNRLGHVEICDGLREKLLQLPPSTLEVLTHQINEILSFEFKKVGKPYQQPCFFGMSIYDPLLDFKVTRECLKKLFSKLIVKRFFFRFHQPPKPFSFEELNQHYRSFLEILSQNKF